MLKKVLLLTVVPIALAPAATLTELLGTVQDTLTRYESDGTALTKPFEYNKMLNYYRYGKLYASYALYKPATEMLELASCTAAPLDCRAYKYFVKALHPENYRYLRNRYPILAAKVETSYNAYASWWIGKRNGEGDYSEFKNLEAVLRSDFLSSWRDFLKVAKRPLYFQISKKINDADRFLLTVLKASCRKGWIKKMVFYGDKGNYLELLHSGLIDYRVGYRPYNCPFNNFLVVY